ncbi:4-oxalocrotonate tautomerase DmpI [Desulfofustis glycolicus]|uniref:4-oxalocrotonate tautomerase n=1 Tax=Desulfofustis glycolicus DSM 9705 TaxID=1121409 RepID=A0A1M5XYQ5_9BACT|nr:4-oxalocrotonate tautomerase DmpI [Desulfofustis glycolicus]MCB2218282.1 4-oxalocrotonate tautomerase family protein [Desulfobulbaceae bacterium]SHI04951.1 4-oxalocrotonate tautomerase [Desulfofustis glycolicus DSM 9705]
MPIISVALGEGQTSTKQREELIRRLTSVAIDITKLPAQAFTVLINELPNDNIGVAGKTLAELRGSGAL